MIPAKLPTISITRGDDETFSLLFMIDDITPYDLSVWKEIRSQVRLADNYTGGLLCTFTTSDGSLEISGTDNNRLIFKLNGSKTILFTDLEASYYLDIRVVDNSDELKTLLSGTIKLRLNITEKQ